MHSVTGTVTQLDRVTAGYGENMVAVGINVRVTVIVPYVKLDEYNDNKPTQQDMSTFVVVFYPSTEVPPAINDEVTVSLVPADENVSIN